MAQLLRVFFRGIPFLAVLLVTAGIFPAAPQDENASRKSRNTNTRQLPPAPVNRNRIHRPAPAITTPPKAKFANLIINVSPADSSIVIDNQEIDNSAQHNGQLSLSGVTAAEHTLVVRHPGYSDQQLKISPKPGANDPINISLSPLKGTLTVKPSVPGASIAVHNVEQDQNVGTFDGVIDSVELPPGRYELTLTKPGYQDTTRGFAITPGGLVFLEPVMTVIPAPTPTPVQNIPAGAAVEIDGKFLLVGLRGTSGDPNRINGTINVTTGRTAASTFVRGSLSGGPCQVAFVAIENVAEWSLVETPSPSNHWSVVIVRARPKDAKRPISFAINWSALTRAAEEPVAVPLSGNPLTRAVILYRAQPEYPQMARSSRTSGEVTVSVLIDEAGNVKSAKALEGPTVLRQAAENAARRCRFRPARRNGVPTQTTETIVFVFKMS